MSKLALLGGQPVFAKSLPYFDEIWPPVDASTAQKLQDLYYSRKWTAFQGIELGFAKAFAEYHGARHGVFMMNGTVTLQLALGAYGIGPGDEVIVPPLTWYATAIAARHVGSCPVFVDIEPDTLCIDPEKIEAAITDRTKAIIPVHTYGSMADMERIMAIAKRHGLKVIEDCAHVHGGIWDGKGIGSIGDIGSFSFQHSKTMSSGEGGMCITSDPEIADRLYRAKHVGYASGDKQRQAKSGPPAGLMCYNYRAMAFQAVMLQEQLKTLESRLEIYRKATSYLQERLEQTTHIRFQKTGRKADRQSRFHWVMIFDHPAYVDIPIDVIQAALGAEGVVVYPTEGPMYRSPLWNVEPSAYRIPQPCSVAEFASAHVLCLLHAYLLLGQEQVERIADAVEKVASNADALRRYASRSEVAEAAVQ